MNTSTIGFKMTLGKRVRTLAKVPITVAFTLVPAKIHYILVVFCDFIAYNALGSFFTGRRNFSLYIKTY